MSAGIYVISNTLKIPAGVQIVGEAWTTVMASGSAFSSIASPKVAVQVGTTGSTGIAEISSLLFTTRAPAGGAILVEWNVHDPSNNKGAAGMWDTVCAIFSPVHIRSCLLWLQLFRLGGAKGTSMSFRHRIVRELDLMQYRHADGAVRELAWCKHWASLPGRFPRPSPHLFIKRISREHLDLARGKCYAPSWSERAHSHAGFRTTMLRVARTSRFLAAVVSSPRVRAPSG